MIIKIKDYFKNLIHKKNNIFQLTENRDGFLFFLGESEFDKQLIIDPKRINKIVKYINEKSILNITINDAYFDKIKNLDFIKEIPNIEQISILQDNLDLKPIEKLNKLKSLSFSNSKDKIDLKKLTYLEFLSTDYRKIENLKSCTNLKSISLHFYNQEDLLEFHNFKKLEELFLYRTNIQNFNGIDNLENINKIELHNSPKLLSLKGLPKIAEKLMILYIFNAKKLVDYEGLENLKNIKRLQLDAGGKLENLEIFDNLKDLEFLQLGMEVKNGNKIEFMHKVNKK